MKNFFKRIFGINLDSNVYPEISDRSTVADLYRVEAENKSDSIKTFEPQSPILDNSTSQNIYESNPIEAISESLLEDGDCEKAKLSITELKPKSLKEFNAEDAGAILLFLLQEKELQAAQDFISKIDTSDLPEKTHFAILRLISDLQNSLSPDESLQMLTSFIDAGFNAGACDEENKADVLKIFSEQSKNPAHLESNRALIKKLIQTGKVKGFDNPEKAATLSDMAQRIIQGIDDKTLILTSIAQEEGRKDPQFIIKAPESISLKTSPERVSYKKIVPLELF